MGFLFPKTPQRDTGAIADPWSQLGKRRASSPGPALARDPRTQSGLLWLRCGRWEQGDGVLAGPARRWPIPHKPDHELPRAQRHDLIFQPSQTMATLAADQGRWECGGDGGRDPGNPLLSHCLFVKLPAVPTGFHPFLPSCLWLCTSILGATGGVGVPAASPLPRATSSQQHRGEDWPQLRREGRREPRSGSRAAPGSGWLKIPNVFFPQGKHCCGGAFLWCVSPWGTRSRGESALQTLGVSLQKQRKVCKLLGLVLLKTSLEACGRRLLQPDFRSCGKKPSPRWISPGAALARP